MKEKKKSISSSFMVSLYTLYTREERKEKCYSKKRERERIRRFNTLLQNVPTHNKEMLFNSMYWYDGRVAHYYFVCFFFFKTQRVSERVRKKMMMSCWNWIWELWEVMKKILARWEREISSVIVCNFSAFCVELFSLNHFGIEL